jgi:hypothetical protein
MAYIAKLVCNRLGWTVPSGIDAKSDNVEYGPFEAQVHFGFEEWLFHENHSVELKDGLFFFGFVECFRNNRNFNPIEHQLHLFTQLFSNAANPNQVNTKRYVGFLSGVYPITNEIYNEIIDSHPGIVDRMRTELILGLANDPILADALIEFDKAAENRELFNCLYLLRNRHSIPTQGNNWEYINIQWGAQQYLPNNFMLAEIGQDIILQLQNNQNIPQIQ